MLRKSIPSITIFTSFLFGLILMAPFLVSAQVPTAGELSALLTSCNQVSSGKFAMDDGGPDTVPMCGLTGGIYWTTDMDIDCDGITTAQCNSTTDSSYQSQTSATDSSGNYLNAASLPFVVIPEPQTRFNWQANGIQLGSVVAVIYGGQVKYGVFGDEAGGNFIGEASYAMANSLGIDPNPETGGTAGPVSYIVFTGSSGVANPIESTSTAVTIGQTRACQLINDNGGVCGGSPTPTPTSTPIPTASSSSTPIPSGSSSPIPTVPSSSSPLPSYSYVPAEISFGNVASLNSVSDITSGITNWLLGLASAIFIILIILGGIMYMGSTGDEERMNQAKKLIIYTIIAMAIVLISYTVYNTLSKIIWG